jgi:hypothetical protein
MMRFEEVKLARLREFFLQVLPPSKRSPYKDPDWDGREDPVPVWVTIIHIMFMGWTILTAHYPFFLSYRCSLSTESKVLR